MSIWGIVLQYFNDVAIMCAIAHIKHLTMEILFIIMSLEGR